jgi:hypothetical protein
VKSYDANWDYAHRLSSCSQFITNLGCGYHDYQIMKQTRQPGSPKKLAAAVAEWVDGDALAVHYAFGADVFCTNDRPVRLVRSRFSTPTISRNCRGSSLSWC